MEDEEYKIEVEEQLGINENLNTFSLSEIFITQFIWQQKSMRK
jgi:hypothetical protein